MAISRKKRTHELDPRHQLELAIGWDKTDGPSRIEFV